MKTSGGIIVVSARRILQHGLVWIAREASNGVSTTSVWVPNNNSFLAQQEDVHVRIRAVLGDDPYIEVRQFNAIPDSAQEEWALENEALLAHHLSEPQVRNPQPDYRHHHMVGPRTLEGILQMAVERL